MTLGVLKSESKVLATFLFVSGVVRFMLGVLGGVTEVDGVQFGTLAGGEWDKYPDVLEDVAGCV